MHLRIPGWRTALAGGALAALVGGAAVGDRDDEPRIDFGRDIKPILSDNCYFCHGPDSAQRKGGLRLDDHDAALGELRSGATAIVPGDIDGSELVYRIQADFEGDRMPPAESGKSLTKSEVALLLRWIEEGAAWEERHWSLTAPTRPAAPVVSDVAWPRGEIDRFVLAGLDAAGLHPSPEAPKETLLRRASLDLTGLPPTLAELDAFLADEDPGAYERAVDRLFASPRYGEHMARYWLDAARYGDTHGLHLDNERSMWRYREWVIDAFNANQPFDQFTIEQLAGDLLPDPTIEQLIASGFNRCNPTSAEGGMIADEYLALYAMDRVDTTSTVWMGLTLACAKCHDHKFDSFSQDEYYELFAFFNSLAEEATDRNITNPAPFIRAPKPEHEERLAAFAEEVATVEAQVAAPMPGVDAAQAEWERGWSEALADRWRILVPDTALSTDGTTLGIRSDDSILATGANPATDVFEVRAFAGESRITAVRLEALVDESIALDVPGRSPNHNYVLSGFEVEAFPPGRPEDSIEVSFVDALATHSQEKYDVRGALDADVETGWGGLGATGSRSAVFVASEPFGFEGGTELTIRLRHESRFAQHAIGCFRLAVAEDPALSYSELGTWYSAGPFVETDGRASLTKPFAPEQGVDLSAAYGDGDLWAARPEYEDGKVHLFDTDVGAMYLFRTIDSAAGTTLRAGLGSDDGLRVWLNGELVHDNPAARGVALDQDFVDLALRAGRNELLLKVANYGGGFGFAFRRIAEDAGGLPTAVATALATAPELRGPTEARLLRKHYRKNHSPEWNELDDRLTALRAEVAAFEATIPTTMISRELEERRQARVLMRGQYDQPGEEVDPDVPGVLPPLAEDAPRNRLGLARWLVSGEHPLTARVTVNRYWQRFFGTGLVDTPEDFGSQGAWPSHPELLDWLAVEFVESGWDVAHVQRLIVTSSAYRQSSRVTPELYAVDPYNRLLARGPRFRLDAEAIRDSALSVGGLLVDKIGGESVKPYQPIGVWKAVGYTSSNTANYMAETGDALYRRSLYTFWKRTAPPPNMVTFDAPSREACTVRRARTNTPLQALVLLNDPQFVEAARGLAQRLMTEAGDTPAERAAFAFRLATSRRPSARELEILVDAFERQLRTYRARPDDARALLGVGESAYDDSLDVAELAAWANVASMILNLDETVTRG